MRGTPGQDEYPGSVRPRGRRFPGPRPVRTPKTRAARAHAFLDGRGYVVPQDVKDVAPMVLLGDKRKLGV